MAILCVYLNFLVKLEVGGPAVVPVLELLGEILGKERSVLKNLRNNLLRHDP